MRNESRSREVSTPTGDVEGETPKPRKGSNVYALIENTSGSSANCGTQDLLLTSLARLPARLTTLLRPSGVSRESASMVSRICADIDCEVAPVGQRPVSHTAFPYVSLDATYVKTRMDHQFASHAVVISIGVTTEGGRKVLVVSDAHPGLQASICKTL